MGKKLKQIIKFSKKTMPVAKKVMPIFASVVSSMNLLENASAIAKPIAENIREKNSERAKRIEAIQMKADNQIVIKIEKANIFACAADEDSAFNLFLIKLNELSEKKILSSNIKIQKEQIALIEKLNRIMESGGALKAYIYRIEIEEKVEEQIEKKVEGKVKKEIAVKGIEDFKTKFSMPLKRKISFKKRK